MRKGGWRRRNRHFGIQTTKSTFQEMSLGQNATDFSRESRHLAEKHEAPSTELLLVMRWKTRMTDINRHGVDDGGGRGRGRRLSEGGGR